MARTAAASRAAGEGAQALRRIRNGSVRPVRILRIYSRQYPDPVEGAVLDRLAHVERLDRFALAEVGDRPRELEHPVVGAGREPETGDGIAEEIFDRLLDLAPPSEIPRSHVRVGV